jgi:hypothetical protein
MDPIRRTMLRASVGQCGRDSDHFSLQTVRAVATMDCPAALGYAEKRDTSLYCAATLHRFGLHLDYAKLDNFTHPGTCSCCNAPLWDPGVQATRADRIFVWQSHLGRCGGDDRRHQAHEAVKLAMQATFGALVPGSGLLRFPKRVHPGRNSPRTFVKTNRALVTSMRWERDSTEKNL